MTLDTNPTLRAGMRRLASVPSEIAIAIGAAALGPMVGAVGARTAARALGAVMHGAELGSSLGRALAAVVFGVVVGGLIAALGRAVALRALVGHERSLIGAAAIVPGLIAAHALGLAIAGSVAGGATIAIMRIAAALAGAPPMTVALAGAFVAAPALALVAASLIVGRLGALGVSSGAPPADAIRAAAALVVTRWPALVALVARALVWAAPITLVVAALTVAALGAHDPLRGAVFGSAAAALVAAMALVLDAALARLL